MRLLHAGDVDKNACNVSGPYDVVLMDMTLTRLLHALLQVMLSHQRCQQCSPLHGCKKWVSLACLVDKNPETFTYRGMSKDS